MLTRRWRINRVIAGLLIYENLFNDVAICYCPFSFCICLLKVAYAGCNHFCYVQWNWRTCSKLYLWSQDLNDRFFIFSIACAALLRLAHKAGTETIAMSAWELKNGWILNSGTLPRSASRFWNHVGIALLQPMLESMRYCFQLLVLADI